MKQIQLLDCTLREAPIEKLMWGDTFIKKIIRGLENAHVDYIEVGFLKNEEYVLGSTSFKRVEDIEPYLKNKKEGVTYVALVDYGRYDTSNLSPYDGKSIDAVRICFKHHEIDKVLDYAQEFRDKGYQVTIQHVDTMGFTDKEIINFIDKVNAFHPLAYAVVDTFGAMYTNDMLRLARIADAYLDKDIILGFHGHNNIMLADANAQKFIEEIGERRNVIVDTSLYGCGRSAGNAHTELMTQFLNTHYDKNYDINEILDLIDTVINAVREKTKWGYSIPYFISGMHNAHTFNVVQLLKRHNLKSKDLRGIIGMLDDTQKKAYDYDLLEKLYVEYFGKEVDDKAVVSELGDAWKDETVLLLAPGRSLRDKKDDVNAFIEKNHPVVIAVNNIIDGFSYEYVFFSSALRYQNLQYHDYKKAGSPKIILTSNVIDSASDENERVINYKSLIKHGWSNFDSSAILLMRLLIRCGVRTINVAGMDGLVGFGSDFYSDEMDNMLEDKARAELTADNMSMMKDLLLAYPDLRINFVTDTVYNQINNGEN